MRNRFDFVCFQVDNSLVALSIGKTKQNIFSLLLSWHLYHISNAHIPGGLCLISSVPLAGFDDFLCPVTLVIVKTCNKSWCILERFFTSSLCSFFFPQDYPGYWSFAFPYILKLICVFTITALWFSLRWLWLSISLGRIDVSAILSLSNHDHLHIFWFI